MRAVTRTGLWVAAVAALFPVRALAQDVAAAEVAFREGRALVSEGRYDEACAKFEQSFDLEAATGTLLNLADCQEHLGKTASAWASFRKAAERARSERRPKPEAEARRRAAQLKPRLTRLRVDVAGEQPDVRVERDGVEISALVGIAVPVDPGIHAISATRDGHRPWRATVTARGPGETKTVIVGALERIALPESVRQVPKTTRPLVVADDTKRRDRRQLALGIAGFGVVAAVGAGATALLADRYWNDAQSNGCVDGRCTERIGFDDARRARRLAIGADVLVGVGALSLGVAAVLWLTAPDPERRLTVAPRVSNKSAGLALSTHF